VGCAECWTASRVHRLVIALTTLLALTGAAVVAGYLFLFAAQPDRAAQAVPAGSAAYGTLYLQPSTGQRLNLARLLGHVPGFEDAANLDVKIHDIAARLLGQAGLDYERDVRPWLGNQVAVAVQPDGLDPSAGQVLALLAVKDRAEAEAAMARIATDRGLAPRADSYQGTQVQVADSLAWAMLDDLLLVGSDEAVVRAAIDADAGRTTSLGDSTRFRDAMQSVPPDHIASFYVDLEGLGASTGLSDELGGYSTASLALVIEQDGVRLAGSAPFRAEAAPSPAREAFALASEPSSLTEWMPAGTQLEAVVFGLSQTLRAAEQQLGTVDTSGDISAAITQLRAIAVLGLGIDVDADLLPLLDRETAVGVSGLETGQPHGQLLLRPSDAAAAADALERMRGALVQRGATENEVSEGEATITELQVPDIGTVAYAVRNGVVMIGLSTDDVASALAAGADGGSLAEDERYRAAWDLAGVRGGNEAWVDAGALLDATGDDLGVTGDLRDILLQVGAVALTAPARDDHSEFHVVVTAR
jgi:hypothetical protein